MKRREFLLSTALAATVPLNVAAAKPQPKRVRIHLVDWPAGTPLEHIRAVAELPPTRCLTVAAQEPLLSWRLGDALVAGTTHTAESLQPCDTVAKRRVYDGDVLDPTTQLWVVCSVEVVS